MNDIYAGFGIYATVYACTEDLIKALGERPAILRWLIRILMGKYAWHELVLAKRHIEKYTGFDCGNWGYGLEGCEYHKDKNLNSWAYMPEWEMRERP